MAEKIKIMTSFSMFDGSWTASSTINKTAPTSLKQFEANKNEIPAASMASPKTGATLLFNSQAS